ncbi:AAA family ATPase [Streptomyces mirabilis]|uniref:AAA family ATPase n=1 Tax=Streptomyces mirabilis TaxID=68239 RepID=UPI002E1BA48F|nr:AAA family ATPase [Streptomyces mirabilis]
MDSDRVLTQVKVVGLLGRFQHTVDFPASDEFVIVHGPNGVGKTLLLDLISAIAWPVDFGTIVRVPFKSLTLRFDDGTMFTVDKGGPQSAAADESEIPSSAADSTLAGLLALRLFLEPGSGSGAISWSPQVHTPERVDSFRTLARLVTNSPDKPSGMERRLRDYLAHGPLESDATLLEALPRWDSLPETLTETLTEALAVRIPTEMRDVLRGVVVHSIDTHRLLGLSAPEERRGRPRQRPSLTKVEEFATDLARRLAKELAENSRTSQELDRTYPQRLLEDPAVDVSEQEIRERYDAQNDLRRQLGDISLVDERTSVIEIPERMEPWQRTVLWTYLRDTEAKLATFKDTLDRVSRLREIVNRRFLFKNLEIDRERGFRVVSDEERDLDLASLSSGEQHELVLAYDLLFNVPSGALVLIDEPEISLHVSWQKGFIADLRTIASLVDFRTIVATHSPQIAGKWADRMVILGPTAE